MVNVAQKTLEDVDVILWLVEAPTYIGPGEKYIAEQLEKTKKPVILVINKVDTIKKEEILAVIDAYRKLYDFREIVPTSALRGQNMEDLIGKALNQNFVPVLDDQKSFIGIITRKDIIKYFYQKGEEAKERAKRCEAQCGLEEKGEHGKTDWSSVAKLRG